MAPTADVITDAEYVAIVFSDWGGSHLSSGSSWVAAPGADPYVSLVETQIGAAGVVFNTLQPGVPDSPDAGFGVAEWFQAEADLLRAAQGYLRSRGERTKPAPELIQAWDRFYAQYDPLLRRMASGHRIPVRDFDDLMQEIWIELSRKLVRLVYDPTRGRLRDWLRIVVHRKARDFCRYKRGAVREVAHSLSTVPCQRRTPPELAEREDMRAIVQAAIRQLRGRVCESTYQVLHLTHFGGRTVVEIAAHLGLSPQQVWSRQHRGKQALRAILLSRQEFRRRSATG